MADFLQAPGMDWTKPGGVSTMLGDAAVGAMPAGRANQLAMSMARERLNAAKTDEVRARIGRIHAITSGDVAKQQAELAHLRQKYPLLIEQLEQEIDQGATGFENDQERQAAESAARVGVHESQAGSFDALARARDAVAAKTGSDAQIEKDKAAAELKYLEQRYPLLLEQLEGQIGNAADESEAKVLAAEGLANARNADAAAAAAGAADKARMDAELLAQLRGRYPGLLAMDEAKLAETLAGTTREDAESAARIEAIQALAGEREAGADTEAARAALLGQQGERYGQITPHAVSQAESEAGIAGTQDEMERARIQSIIDRNNRAGGGGGVPGVGGAAGVDPLNPYSTAGNRFNDDVTSLVKQMYAQNVLTDPVDGQMMLPTDPGRERRQLQIIRAAQNLAAVSIAAGQPLTPQQAVIAAIEAVRDAEGGGGMPNAATGGTGGLPGGPVPAGPAQGGGDETDPLGIRRGGI